MLKSIWWKTVLAASLAAAAWGQTFGTVVPIGGEAADLALDETRGVLYIANFTGNQIDVMSLATNTIQTSINVAAQPSSIALSPDDRYLLATNYGNAAAPGSPTNALTVIDLTNQNTQTFSLGNPPLGVAFGADGIALVVTSTDFLLFDPSTGATQELDTLANVVANTLPVAPANFPADITAASVAASADGLWVYGLGGTTSTVTFTYDVNAKAIFPGAIVTNSGVLGPRVISVNSNGSLAMAGWVMFGSQGFVNFFPEHTNQFSVGSTAFDDSRGLLYAQIPAVQGEAPTLMVVTSSNLTLQERLQLAENLSGKSVLSSDKLKQRQ
jgi:DNA-binding beta-propeller fold protein YncE